MFNFFEICVHKLLIGIAHIISYTISIYYYIIIFTRLQHAMTILKKQTSLITKRVIIIGTYVYDKIEYNVTGYPLAGCS